METEYLSYINNFKKSLQSQISEFSFKVESYVNEMESKNKHFEKLEENLMGRFVNCQVHWTSHSW